MNNMIIKRILLVLVAVFVWSVVYSQESNAISYQAIARDASGATVKDKKISVRISIIDGSVSGEVVYQEIHHPVTDKSGVVSLMIGKGETSDDFSGINWSSGVFYLRTEMDINGGSNYSISSTSRMLSVPYALYAEKATVLDGNFVMADDMNLANVLSNGNDAEGLQIKGLAVPTDENDAINKAYMDSVIESYIPRTIATLPEPYTRRAYDITATEAKLRGRITSDGGALVEEKGFLVGRQQESLTDSVSCGAGKGDFICRLSGLEPNTTYYYKLYAKNSEGIAYGDEKSFTTSDLFVDERDGTIYTMVNLGSRTWMAENLRYEGDIPVGTEGSSTEAYRYFPMGEESNVQTYGYLYNMTAAMNGATDSVSSQGYIRGICPAGWHIPSRNDVQTLSAYNLSGHFDTFNYYEYWDYETNDVFGTSGFNMLNSGEFHSGTYTDNSYSAFWLAPEQNDVANAWVYSGSGWHFEKYDAVSMRCIRDVGINATVPTISATAIDIYSDRATLRGIVMDDGGTLITDNGFQYGTDSTTFGSGIQSDDISAFTHTLSGLIPNTTYYIRSYATNSNGTVWSGISSFSTHGNFVDERDGNVYDMITIGDQTWMAVNLRYEGDIPLGNGNAEIAYRDYPNGDANNVEIYGYLYNWTAAMNGASGSSDNPSGVQGICPNGWHLPSNAEWIQLVENIGGEDNAGAQLAGNPNLWNYYEYDGCLVCSPQFGTSGFNAQPVDDSGIGSYAYFWTATEYDDYDAYVRSITYTSTSLSQYTHYKGAMLSARCVLGEGVLSNVSVATQSASEISTTSATLHATITSDGGEEIISRGFIYGTDYNHLTENVQSADETEDFAYTLTYLEPNTTYYYKAYARNSTGTGYGEVVSFTTIGLDGYMNGHGYVDLGLPSGTLWATTNVGAENPEDYGNYYAWGETEIKETYGWETYRYANGSETNLTKYCDFSEYGNWGYVDTLTALSAIDDVANVVWGEGWRLPTLDEMSELIYNCEWELSVQNNEQGYLITGNNGNSIFLPLTGYKIENDIIGADIYGLYWSCSLSINSNNPENAWYMEFSTDDYRGNVVDGERRRGLPVRPVYNPSTHIHLYTAPTVSTSLASDNTTSSATLYGNIVSDGGAEITERGFVYGTDVESLNETVISTDETDAFSYTVTGLSNGTTYYYKAYAINNEGIGYGPLLSFVARPSMGNLNNHNWVDLKLPSGLLWATTNIGAANPEDYGDYYAWGETATKDTYGWDNYIYYNNGNSTSIIKYCSDESYGYNGFTDTLTVLEAIDDAAAVNWGGSWKIPTLEEFNELFYHCTWEQTEISGVSGYLFTGINGNSIFLPTAGSNYTDQVGVSAYYWTSSLLTNYPDYAHYLELFNQTMSFNSYGGHTRVYGHSVRPVCTYSLSNNSLPFIITKPATNFYSTAATLHALITYVGNTDITSRGFMYGTDVNNLTETVQSTDETTDFAYTLTGLTPSTTYYYKAFATNSEGTGYGDVMSFTTSPTTGQLSGHTWVDLGLPSGTRWATTNVGAENPEDYGDYYAWGETQPHYSVNGTDTTWLNGYEDGYSWTTYRYCNGSESTLTKYCNDESYGNEGFTDTLTTLESIDDAATANWGAGWRMPTQEELQELYDNCIREWTEQNGVSGYLFTGPNGNSIFLPAAGDSDLYNAGSIGYYWSSSLDSGYTSRAWDLQFDSVSCRMSYLSRYYGQSVRAVCQSQN